MNSAVVLLNTCLLLFNGRGVFSDEQQSASSTTHPPGTNFSPLVNITKCGGDTICKEVFNYPEEHILQALQGKSRRYNHLFGEDKAVADVFNRNLDVDQSLCGSFAKLEEPKAGVNKDNEWIFIVNHGEYKQAIETRLCTNVNSVCNMDQIFPYRTECRQKYIFRKMLALDPKDGQLQEDAIKIPSCCSCHFFEKKKQ